VFGYIASRSGQPENVATEALNYVLNGSVVAKRAFLGYVAQTKVELPDTLLFRTKAVGEDNAIPDLVGMDSESRQAFLVEAKFWAGLTSNQPVMYLKRLPSVAAGLLLFIAPARRFDTLWAELLRRCRNEGFVVGQPQNDIAGALKAIGAGTRHTLALTSWRAVLAYMLRALETEGEHHVVSDVQQLQGLCERMDSEAFLPLRSEELASDTGKHIMQYCEVVDEAVEQARIRGITLGRLRRTSQAGLYGRFCQLQGHQCHLQFNAQLWGRLRTTPLWLRIDQLQSKPWLRDALVDLEREQPPRLIPGKHELLVPIDLPTGVEKQNVVSAVVEQLLKVGELLRDYERPDQSESDLAT
jgi:hypothetical protein